MSQIRHNNPLLHRVVRPGGWLTSGNRKTDQIAPTALDMGALVDHLTAQGWSPEPQPGGLHVAEGDSTEEADITLAHLLACDIGALPDALEHDVRTELTRQGLCP